MYTSVCTVYTVSVQCIVHSTPKQPFLALEVYTSRAVAMILFNYIFCIYF